MSVPAASPPHAAHAGAGTHTLEEGPRIDLAGLRADRRVRLLATMEAEDLDVVLLGRPGNVRFASGARQLWTAGARSFAPSCVVVRETGGVHLLSVWDEGVPADIDRSHLFGISWNPGSLAASLRRIPGLEGCRRAGTDSLNPLFRSLLADVAPRATFVDAAGPLERCRRQKSPEEVACIATAASIAESLLACLVEAVRPGVTERELVGRYAEQLANLGVPTPPTEAVCTATARRGPVTFRQLSLARPIGPDELVVLSPGALYAGYEAALARTTLASGDPSPAHVHLATRARSGLEALVGSCRPGARGIDLLGAWQAATAAPLPSVPLVHGLGLGAEPPVVGAGRGEGAVLEAGMVLSVQSWSAAEGTGGVLLRDTVLVGTDGPVRLTRFPTLPVRPGSSEAAP